MFTSKKEKLLEQALKMYAGAHVLERINRLGESALQLYMEPRELTVAFFDVAGFTVGHRDQEGKWALGIANEYMSIVTRAVTQHGGTIDSFVGDSIFAYWGLTDDKDHAELACDAILTVLSLIQEWSAACEKEGRARLTVHMGVHTGAVQFGNYGTPDRIKMTALGDVVNFGSRLCDLCASQATECLISEATRARLPKRFVTVPIGRLTVKGYDTPIEAHALRRG